MHEGCDNMRLLTLLLMLLALPANAANIRPSTETTYTIQTSDLSDYVIGTNQGAGMVWTLDTLSTYGSNPTFTVKNNSRYELVIRPTGNAIGTFAGVKTYSLALQAGQSAKIWTDNTDWQYTASPAAMLAAMGNGQYILSSSPITREWFVNIAGTCHTGDVVGFDWSSTSPSFSLSFRHTMNCALSNPWKDAGDDLSTQFKNNATVQSALTPDIALQASYLYDTASVGVYFNGNYTLMTTSTITLTAYKSSGATETVVAAPGALILGNPTGTIVGRSPSTFGKAPGAGDGLYILLVIGDTSQGPAPVLTNVPDYGRMSWSINNPDTANLASDFSLHTGGGRRGTATFQTKSMFLDADQVMVGAGSIPAALTGNTLAFNSGNGIAGFAAGSLPGSVSLYAVNATATGWAPFEFRTGNVSFANGLPTVGGSPVCINASGQLGKC
jgi:hypothetical protein